MEKLDIHKNNNLKRRLKSISSWKIPKVVQKDIELFISKAQLGQVNVGKRLSDRTLVKYLTLLKHDFEIINKPVEKITKTDIENFDKTLSEEKLKSDYNYKVALQIFLKWKLGAGSIEAQKLEKQLEMEKRKRSRKEIEEMKIKIRKELDEVIKLGSVKAEELAGWLDKSVKTKTPNYLSEKETEALYMGCKNAEERYIIATFFDGGGRIEENLNVRMEDIQLPENGEQFVKITLREEFSKTKGRTISLYWKHSLNAVRDYLNQRIAEGIKKEEPVLNKPYDSVRFFLKRLGNNILKKPIYPHLFRHSSATYYATRMNRQELCYRYGWSFTSDMPDIYISRSGMENKQLDEKFKNTQVEVLEKELEKYKYDSGVLKENVEKIKENNEQITKALWYFFEKHKDELKSFQIYPPK